jgi:hypothetical protein
MRRLVGWLLIAIGALAVLLGVIGAVVFGPDDTVTTAPHRLTTTGSAIVTAPSALPFFGSTLLVTATSPLHRSRLFLGIAADSHVRGYLARTSYTRIDSLSLPWSPQETRVSTQVTRRRESPKMSTQQSWWVSRSTSAGGSRRLTATLPLPEDPVDVVLMDLRHRHGFTVDVIVGVLQPGVFLGSIAAVVAGFGLAALGEGVRRSAGSLAVTEPDRRQRRNLQGR